MSGKHPGRQRKPKPFQDKQKSVQSPESGEFWIFDVASKATYYPTSLAKFKRTYARLRSDKKELKTSHKI